MSKWWDDLTIGRDHSATFFHMLSPCLFWMYSAMFWRISPYMLGPEVLSVQTNWELSYDPPKKLGHPKNLGHCSWWFSKDRGRSARLWDPFIEKLGTLQHEREPWGPDRMSSVQPFTLRSWHTWWSYWSLWWWQWWSTFGLKTRIFAKETTGHLEVWEKRGGVSPKVLNQSPAGLEVGKDGTTTFSPDWKVAQTSLSNMISPLLFLDMMMMIALQNLFNKNT